ncbi:MAG: hypothetical protein IC227_03615 [Enterococcus lacertideformus]|uniref:Uncharacterized protein n=1 Tax=Enterococcus lacertideformus TaxID=2771493 RepID=A0A931B1N0_9ENTE|nr:hypothetical protein [Enterococcus lacertideformus]
MGSLAIVKYKNDRYLISDFWMKKTSLSDEKSIELLIEKYRELDVVSHLSDTERFIGSSLKEFIDFFEKEKMQITQSPLRKFLQCHLLREDAELGFPPTILKRQPFDFSEITAFKKADDNEKLLRINAILGYQELYGFSLLNKKRMKEVPLRIVQDYKNEFYVGIDGLTIYYEALVNSFAKYLSEQLNTEIFIGSSNEDLNNFKIQLLFQNITNKYEMHKIPSKVNMSSLYLDLYSHRGINIDRQYYIIDSMSDFRGYRVQLINEEFKCATKYFYGLDLTRLYEKCNSFLFGLMVMNNERYTDFSESYLSAEKCLRKKI